MYKSLTNDNVTYECISCVKNKKKFGGIKLVLKKTIMVKKKVNLWLFNIPWVKKIKTIKILWKPDVDSPFKNKWVFLKENFNNYNIDYNKIHITEIVENKSFVKLLNQIIKEQLS